MIRVVLADDQDLVRTGLRALLERDADIEVVAEARTGREAASLVALHRPDVVLMDLRMPDVDGLEATRRIRADERAAGTRVLVVTTFDDDADVFESVRSGAAGYVLKDATGDELRRAVHATADGGSPLSPAIARRLLDRLAATLPRQEATDALADVTERERDVLRLVAEGATNAELAGRLHISHATARTYVSRLLTKTGARDRTELAILAVRAGLGD